MDTNLKTALIIGGVIVAALIILPQVFGLISGGQSYGYGMMGTGMMGGFAWMWLIPVLFMGLIVWGIVAVVRGVSQSGGSDSASRVDSALEVLKKRYARGEIDKEEYEEKKKDLA